MSTRMALGLSALLYAVCTAGAAFLARRPSSLAHVAAAVLVAAAIVGSAALTPARTFSRRVLVEAGAILAACMALPLAFVQDPAAWLRQSPSLLGYFWLWLMILGLPSGGGRGWCASPRLILLAAAVLGGATVATALW